MSTENTPKKRHDEAHNLHDLPGRKHLLANYVDPKCGGQLNPVSVLTFKTHGTGFEGRETAFKGYRCITCGNEIAVSLDESGAVPFFTEGADQKAGA